MKFVYVSSTWRIIELKTPFEMWITRNDVSGASFYYLYYLIKLMVSCAHKGHQISKSSILFHWSLYRIFVLNTRWKRDYFQMMIFVNFCSTWSMVELKTRFETWITRNDLNGVSLFHLSYLITLMSYLCPQRKTNDQI
jgi:hypothetical protein